MRQTLIAVAIGEIDRLAHAIESMPGVCVYCGDDSTTVDHLAPRSYSGWHLHTVPACRRCNTVLGALPSASVPERAAHIAQRETVKNRKLLLGVAHELDDYGYALRTALVTRENRRGVLRARLANLRVGGIGNHAFRPIWGP